MEEAGITVAAAISREEYELSGAWGLSAAVDLRGCDVTLITAPRALKVLHDFASGLCREIDMVQHGEPIIDCFGDGLLKGHSMMQFIKTSSLVVHCDDVGDAQGATRVFIDIFSCKFFDQEAAAQFSRRYFRAQECTVRSFLRT